MRKRNLGLALLALFGAGSAFAQSCPCSGGSRLAAADVSTLLQGNTVCAVLGTERWQEWHSGTNFFELGNDFSATVATGSWAPFGTGVGNSGVTYNYGSGGTWQYAVCREGASSVHFCGSGFGGRNITNATVRPGKTLC